MSNVFYVKMNVKAQVDSLEFIASKKDYYPGNLSKGDLLFVRYENEFSPAALKRLWVFDKFEIRGTDVVAKCSPKWTDATGKELFCNALYISQFCSADLFMLDKTTLNLINNPTPKSFFELNILDQNSFDNATKDIASFNSYIKNPSNFRKVEVISSLASANPSSINIQIYKDANGYCHLYGNTKFMSKADIIDSFRKENYILFDRYKGQSKSSEKGKMHSYLKSNSGKYSLFGFYDLFCTPMRRPDFKNYCKKAGMSNNEASNVEYRIRMIEEICGYKYPNDIDQQYDNDKTLSDAKAKVGKSNKYIDLFIDYKSGKPATFIGHVGASMSGSKDSDLDDDYESSELERIDTDLDESFDKDSEESAKPYSYDDVSYKGGENRVIYGTPGCGKSHHIKTNLLNDVEDEHVIRITFHQDYTNTDFVGQIIPVVGDEDKVTYQFVPGPFTLALECAIINSDKKVALVIEELNRGNAASIFGDLFQLLDRKDGISEYELTNLQILDYLRDSSSKKLNKKIHRYGINYTYNYSYIKIPSNLFIYATMNTSDQNVYTLDTAFKRRWKFKKLSNTFTKDDTIGDKYIPGLTNVTWKTFVEKINSYMIKDGTFDSEDKQIGKYFIDSDMLLDAGETASEAKIEEFAYKILEYLWNDVAKFDREKWFNTKDYNTLDKLIEGWKADKGAEIFNSKISFDE